MTYIALSIFIKLMLDNRRNSMRRYEWKLFMSKKNRFYAK